jgi:hypothetical protein
MLLIYFPLPSFLNPVFLKHLAIAGHFTGGWHTHTDHLHKIPHTKMHPSEYEEHYTGGHLP